MATEDRIISGLFLCSDSGNEILQFIKPEWNGIVALSATDKLAKINKSYTISSVFPWQEQLSNGVNHEEFCKSFFIQPDLFLRLRPGYENAVKKKLTTAGIPYAEIDNQCLSVSNTSKVDIILDLDREAVVQDLNSQGVGELMKSAISKLPASIKAWDCCAASGGKSILCYDLKPDVQLTVSDIRENILINLKKRFAKAGITNYKSFIADLSQPGNKKPEQLYDFIIADVPCSGSGTWSRTPEHLFYFNEAEMDRYNVLQQNIAGNVINYLKPGGYLLYITCSVLKKENEQVVEYITRQKKLEIEEMRLFAGYNQKADTLFATLLYKPL